MNNKILRKLIYRIKQRFCTFDQATPFEVEKSEQSFYISYLQEGMVAFDIGANIGEITLLFSRFVGSSGEVHAFEASQSTYGNLEAICQIVSRSNIHINHYAVADTEGVLTLNVYDEQHSGWNSLANRPLEKYGIDIKPDHYEKVQSIRLDRYCEQNNINCIDLLKIDVEGAEYQVMLGAESLFKSKRIRCCVFEFGATTFDMGNKPDDIKQFLKGCGYSIKNIVKGNPIFPGGQSPESAKFSLHVATPVQ